MTSGIEGVRRIPEQFPELPIPMLTVHGDSADRTRRHRVFALGWSLLVSAKINR